MSYEDHRILSFLPKIDKRILDAQSRECIKCSQRLIKKKRVRLIGQRPDKSNSLSHASRQLIRIRFLKLSQLHKIEKMLSKLRLILFTRGS